MISLCREGQFTSFGEYTVKDTETIDGFKYILDDDRWLMIRPSGTEPVLRVYCQAPDAAEVRKILDAAKKTILG